MPTVQELALRLGMSERQVYTRIEKLGEVLRPFIRRGPRNEILLDGSGLRILEELHEREKLGKTLHEAVAELKAELRRPPAAASEDPVPGGGSSNGHPSTPLASPAANPQRTDPSLIELLSAQIEELRRDKEALLEQIRTKDRQIDELNARLSELTTLLHNQLPPTPQEARERRWWKFWK